MDVSESAMTKALMPLLISGEMSLCPVLATVKCETRRVGGRTSEFAYVTVTNYDRLIMYRFDEYSSHVEYYTFDTVIYSELSTSGNGQYIAEFSFLTEKGKKDIYMTFMPQIKGNAFPHQNKNAQFLYEFLSGKSI
ncbi:MAG: hypothetical protein II820_05300 [Ruminiclostridium sp.]|nr:hypothetical protein [Ruminiclostridium sp.]